MVFINVLCPECGGLNVVKHGKLPSGEQRYRCNDSNCKQRTFILNYQYKGCLPEVKIKIVDLAMNASGIRDTARVLKISPTTVINELKKKAVELQHVNIALLKSLDPVDVKVIIKKVDDAELDEMWSYVTKKDQQRWLWHAIDHRTGKVLAYVLGSRKDVVFLELQKLLAPFGIKRFLSDDWGAYSRHIDPEQHIIGKRNTQKIERKHLTLRTRIKRLVRKTICFSKSIQMHDIIIGLFINRFEFGLAI